MYFYSSSTTATAAAKNSFANPNNIIGNDNGDGSSDEFTLIPGKEAYREFISKTFPRFPIADFKLDGDTNTLHFHDIDLMDLVRRHGTPLRLAYLPQIGNHIRSAKQWFGNAIAAIGYTATYGYAFCLKSSQFRFVVDEALKNDVHLETSSEYEIGIIRSLFERGAITREKLIICNGYKLQRYARAIVGLLKDGFNNVIPVLDSVNEIHHYRDMVPADLRIGIGMRMAPDEDDAVHGTRLNYFTSRFGIRYEDVLDVYNNYLKHDPRFELNVLHYFITSGIRDDPYYWSELSRFVRKYCQLKKHCPTLNTIDIGGGFTIRLGLDDHFDYQDIVAKILQTVKRICRSMNVPEPHILTEFGMFTVGESGVTIFGIVDEKVQSDREHWYMVDGSIITCLSDTIAYSSNFLCLPINGWDRQYHEVKIGGVSCDSLDYYDSKKNRTPLMMPHLHKDDNQTLAPQPLYVGFFHMGAYQESFTGFGGIKHCLIPSPKFVLLDRGADGKLVETVFAEEQGRDGMLNILGHPLPKE